MKHEKVVDYKEPATQMMNGFEPEAKLLHYVRAPAIHSTGHRVKWLEHIPVQILSITYDGRGLQHLRCLDV